VQDAPGLQDAPAEQDAAPSPVVDTSGVESAVDSAMSDFDEGAGNDTFDALNGDS
jgi:hypothetical protein